MVLVLFFILALTGAAYADEPPKIESLCQDLVAYQPSDDVNYVPGADVDADGNPIAPADLDTGLEPIKLPENTRVVITVDQAQQLGLPVNPGFKSEAIIGDVTVNQNGDVTFNGQRISQPQLQVLCKDQDKK